MPKFKLAALDLDGTTLTHLREPHPTVFEAVQEAQSAGITVVLASGRIHPSMARFASALGVEYPIVCGNGAHVLGTGAVELSHVGLDSSSGSVIWDYADSNDLHINLYSRADLFYRAETRWSDLYHERLGFRLGSVVPRNDALAHDITKMMIVDEPSKISSHRAHFEKVLDPKKARMTESEPEYLEFLAPDVDKAHGVQVVANSLGLTTSEVAVLGDYLNDLEMIRWAGLGACVANAHPDVVKAASKVFSSNDNGGAAEFLLSLIG